MTRSHECVACRLSKKIEYLPILLVTGSDENDAKTSSNIEIDGFIQKPFDPDLVIFKVREILDRTR